MRLSSQRPCTSSSDVVFLLTRGMASASGCIRAVAALSSPDGATRTIPGWRRCHGGDRHRVGFSCPCPCLVATAQGVLQEGVQGVDGPTLTGQRRRRHSGWRWRQRGRCSPSLPLLVGLVPTEALKKIGFFFQAAAAALPSPDGVTNAISGQQGRQGGRQPLAAIAPMEFFTPLPQVF
ncbi:hypothetical protein Taro_008089 [Colocasia esculenta]|uniref:Uncharacterized protein n=1 Tax=Colocasia esculenta TaxID=4460 RepID=A0A843U0X6_COLES|nr:hypothetical protein [Colocasia esculenta]